MYVQEQTKNNFLPVWVKTNPLDSATYFSSVQLLSRVQLCDPMDCSMPGFPVHHQLKLMSIMLVMPFNHLILCGLLSFNLSQNQGLLHWVSSLHHVARVLEFQLQSISPSNEYSGLISFRMDWLDLLAVQRTLKSLLQHQSSKASILRRSAFFIVQLSHPYMTTRKTRALTRQTFVGKVMSPLFNMLSRFVIAFFPRSKHLLICTLKIV